MENYNERHVDNLGILSEFCVRKTTENTLLIIEYDLDPKNPETKGAVTFEEIIPLGNSNEGIIAQAKRIVNAYSLSNRKKQ